jgi:serine/threonine-protein kinase RsbW
MSHSATPQTRHEDTQTLTIPRQPQSAARARQFIAAAAGTHPARADAVLLASELITNSLTHAFDATTVTLVLTISPAAIRIHVIDDGTGAIPHLRSADPDAENGYGLRLVNAIARYWGFTRGNGLSCCWAEVQA